MFLLSVVVLVSISLDTACVNYEHALKQIQALKQIHGSVQTLVIVSACSGERSIT